MAECAADPAALADATALLSPGPLIRLAKDRLEVDLAPRAGGRIAQIRFDGEEQLVGPGDGGSAAIAWGCYPMVPWAGRIRDGRFAFDGKSYQLHRNYEGHAIHGFGFVSAWTVDACSADAASLHVRLPRQAFWPFGGIARQRIELGEDQLRMVLSIEAEEHAMPAVIGWHPWFRKPERLDFAPSHVHPRDRDGIATLPLAAPGPSPWDDCFIHAGEVALHHRRWQLQLLSECSHWVVFDALAHATCVEPQTGPPDAFNLGCDVVAPRASIEMSMTLAWHDLRQD